jgi:hypothetical protein
MSFISQRFLSENSSDKTVKIFYETSLSFSCLCFQFRFSCSHRHIGSRSVIFCWNEFDSDIPKETLPLAVASNVSSIIVEISWKYFISSIISKRVALRQIYFTEWKSLWKSDFLLNWYSKRDSKVVLIFFKIFSVFDLSEHVLHQSYKTRRNFGIILNAHASLFSRY